MSINLAATYPSKTAPADANYPFGSAQNITTPGDGTGTPWEATFVNDIVGLMQSILNKADITPSGSPDTVLAPQYLQGILAAVSLAVSYTDTGVADAYVVSPVDTKPGHAAYFVGMMITFSPSANNTGACTVNVDTLGVKSIKYNGGDPGADVLVAGSPVTLVYDGTNFNVLNLTRTDVIESILGLVIQDDIEFEGAVGTNGLIQKNSSAGRDELQLYSRGDAFSTGSAGAGMHLYGNSDSEHAGNVAFLTGQNDDGTARMIIAGGSDQVGSPGYRTNTDTRVTIGNSIWDFVDNVEDQCLLNLKNPQGRPAIGFYETSSIELEIAVPDGEFFTIGHFDLTDGGVTTGRWEMRTDGDLEPVQSGTDLGGSLNRIDTIYLQNSPDVASDQRIKEDIKPIDDKVLDAWEKVNFCQYALKADDSGLIRFGLIAQEVVDAFEAEGLNPFDYNLVKHSVEKDEWVGKGEGRVLHRKAGDIYSLKYEECLVLECALMRRKMIGLTK